MGLLQYERWKNEDEMSAANTAGNTQAYNDLIPARNAWVRQNFGEDANLLAVNQTAPVDLSKPYIAANNTTSGGIVHSIDGSNAGGEKYTTNDMNLLPDPGNISQIQNEGGAWLGGI